MPATTPNTSQSAWQIEVAKYDRPLAEDLRENTNPYAVAAGLALPVPEFRLTTVEAFIEDPAATLGPLQRMGITNFYAGARTTAPGLPNFRNGSDALEAAEIVPSLESWIPAANRSHYNLRVAEFLKGICIAAIIDSEGIIQLDIARGTLPPLTGGRIVPEFTASTGGPRNPAGRLIYYGRPERNEDGELVTNPLPGDHPVITAEVRAAIWRGLSYIPLQSTESEIRRPRLPGRYEFAVVDHAGMLVPIFADAQPQSRYGRQAEQRRKLFAD